MPALVAALVLAGCGSSHIAPSGAAVVGGHAISWSDYKRNLDYSLHFYSWAHSGDRPAGLRCSSRSTDARCRLLQQEVLARLIQERIIMTYAGRHHILLSAADRRRLDNSLSAAAGSSVLAGMHVDRAFLRDLLAREMLVRRVQDAVVAGRANAGPSYHVRKYIVPRAPAGGSGPSFKAALDLATDGQPIPPGTAVRDEWVASFRLSGRERQALDAAQPGQFTGPFTGPRAYLVMQLLGAGWHSYGLPARQAIASAVFHGWLTNAVHHSSLRCFSQSGAAAPCPRV